MYKIYGAGFCHWCTNAKDFLINRDIKFIYVDIQGGEGGEEWRKISKKHNFKTIPQIFKGDVYIGGFNEMSQSIMGDEISQEKKD